MTQLLFPDVQMTDFDPFAPWLVTGFDSTSHTICYTGTGWNKGLQFTLSYSEEPHLYYQLLDKYMAEGKLLLLGKEKDPQVRITIYEKFPPEFFLDGALPLPDEEVEVF